ncbi:MAG: ATP-binding cassette domain-containing protein [Cyanobacteria bacterium J06635_1]
MGQSPWQFRRKDKAPVARVCLDAITQLVEGTPIVQDISFTVPDGEFWVLVGPSGCGKSTLLRTVAGLMPISEGRLYIGDRLVNQVPARQRDVAMVFQNYALYPHMSVAQNLAFGLKMRKLPGAQIKPQIDAIAQSLNLDHLMDRKPGQLSGGQQQRVALGRALARHPQVFLLDEPLSNLDAQLRDKTRAEIKQLHQQFGITTLYVTHDQVEAMTLADQIVVLKAGQIQQMGSPQSIYADPANQMVAAFMGNPPMNMILTRFDKQQLWVGQRSLRVFAQETPPLTSGQLVYLGLRPEQLTMMQASTANAESSGQIAHGPLLNVTVAVVEPLGRETLIKASLCADSPVITDPDLISTTQSIHFLAPPTHSPKAGERLTLSFDPADVFLFDAQTGERLWPTRSGPHKD